MAYSPHSWQSNETITGALLNHMEHGIQTAQSTADTAMNNPEAQAAVDLAKTILQARIRDLEKRVTTLET